MQGIRQPRGRSSDTETAHPGTAAEPDERGTLSLGYGFLKGAEKA
jgi:hypothetical protein